MSPIQFLAGLLAAAGIAIGVLWWHSSNQAADLEDAATAAALLRSNIAGQEAARNALSRQLAAEGEANALLQHRRDAIAAELAKAQKAWDDLRRADPAAAGWMDLPLPPAIRERLRAGAPAAPGPGGDLPAPPGGDDARHAGPTI